MHSAACHDQSIWNLEAVLRCRVSWSIETCRYRGRMDSDSISAIEVLPACSIVYVYALCCLKHLRITIYPSTGQVTCKVLEILSILASTQLDMLLVRPHKLHLGAMVFKCTHTCRPYIWGGERDGRRRVRGLVYTARPFLALCTTHWGKLQTARNLIWSTIREQIFVSVV